MFSSAEIKNRLRSRKMIPPPTRPLITDTNSPRPIQIDEKRVSRYPVPPNQARNAAMVGGFKGDTLPERIPLPPTRFAVCAPPDVAEEPCSPDARATPCP